jgi:formate dehydrogenase major subunit
MGVSRRDFLKISGAGAASTVVGLSPSEAKAESMRTEHSGKTTTICPYCSVGCGMIVETKAGEVVNIEGDPDHPINRGTLCPKGASILQLRNNPKRVTKPLYRGKGATEWKEVSWDWAIENIADKVKKTRDESFESKNSKGQLVNRTMGIASVGSAALDNEEAYMIQKFMRGLGLVYIEHQARL